MNNLISYFSVFAVAGASAATITFDQLSDLDPDRLVTTVTTGANPSRTMTYNDAETPVAIAANLGNWFGTSANQDDLSGNPWQADATFHLQVTFNSFAGTENQNAVIWETGGPGSGVALVYGAGNILKLSHRNNVTNGTLQLAPVTYDLTALIAAGPVDLHWSIEVGSLTEAGTLRLFVNGELVGSTSGFLNEGANLGWAGGNAEGIGAVAGGAGGGFSSPIAFSPAATASPSNGSITLTETQGLSYWYGVALVPEPSQVALLGLSGLLLLRRRRD